MEAVLKSDWKDEESFDAGVDDSVASTVFLSVDVVCSVVLPALVANTVDASDVTATTETTDTVTTGESPVALYVGLGVMLAAAGVYFLTRKKKEA